jgi:Protein of unknown function (DUF3151)
MAEANSVNLSASGTPSTVLDPEEPEALAALALALEQPDGDQRRAAVAAVVARWPRFLDAWAQLATLARDPVEAYAYCRVGYHRGLDRLRASGWRGNGYVRWAEESNRGFLRSLRGLGARAAEIGETDEAERCRHFLSQCDPSGVPAEG